MDLLGGVAGHETRVKTTSRTKIKGQRSRQKKKKVAINLDPPLWVDVQS